MRLKIIVFILIAVLQVGCTSVAVNQIGAVDGGSASGGDRAKAAAIDIVTLPIQAISLPVAAILSSNRDAEIKRSKEKHKKKQDEVLKIYKLLVKNPDIVIKDNYLLKDLGSYEAFALRDLLVKGRGTKFSDEFYSYIYNNSGPAAKKRVTFSYQLDINNFRAWLLRNIKIPKKIIIQAYYEYIATAKNYKSMIPTSPYRDVLLNPKLPKELLIEALQFKSKGIRRSASYGLEIDSQKKFTYLYNVSEIQTAINIQTVLKSLMKNISICINSRNTKNKCNCTHKDQNLKLNNLVISALQTNYHWLYRTAIKFYSNGTEGTLYMKKLYKQAKRKQQC